MDGAVTPALSCPAPSGRPGWSRYIARSAMIGTPLVDSTMAESSALASRANAGLLRPSSSTQMLKRLCGSTVYVSTSGAAGRQQVGDLDLGRLGIRVLNQVEQVEVAERCALGEVPPRGRARQDPALGVAAVGAVTPGHRAIDHDLHVGLHQRRELGGLEAGHLVHVDGRAAHRRHDPVVADRRPIAALEARRARGPAAPWDWRSPAACRRTCRSRPRPGR